MLSIDLSRYIAAGCLVVDRSQAKVSQHLWPISNSTQWQHFGPSKSSNNIDAKKGFQIEDEPTNPLFLAPELQEQLLASSGCLGQYSDLLRKGWVYMTFSPSLDDCEQGVFRVYILPDDVDNRKIPRSDSSLRKVRMRLASLLDFSNSTWQGHTNNPLSPSPSILGTSKPAADSQDGEEQSLLQLFNNLPSPNPRPEDIEDPEVRETAYNLLGSAVTGLKTTLYAYQRRSAALMLQRESQPQQVVDPRLVKVVDQLGVPWYHDSVAGTCLRESRSYDGPCGGILAEEMGSGKTLICLALILASRHIPSATPEHLRNDEPVIRPRVGSLADMAAACATRNSVPWRSAFGCLEPDGIEYTRCIDAIRRNPGFYYLQPPARRRQSRQPSSDPTARKIYLSHCSLVIVPPNLVRQWKQEIAKHTTGLSVFTVDKNQELPSLQELVECDIVLFSSAAFERMWKNPEPGQHIAQVLGQVHFKRCIVDEGHRFGNSTTTRRINIQLLIEHLQISAKWIVTGTPSKGLFGVDDTANPLADSGRNSPRMRQTESSPDLEKDDLKRIGSIASLYLKMRPWANLPTELGDSPADWVVYVMQPKHSSRSSGRADCLKTTLESLIIRHRLSEIGELLPDVDEKIVYLDGSYQDRLVLNLFSMMIIFNAVQSERKDQDYFFHPRQRKALIELVSNLKQASFFGGAFFSAAQIRKAVETAEEFLRERKVPVSTEDEALLRDAIKLGHLAEKNNIKECASLFREVPLYVQKFPWRAGREWSLDFEDVDPVCTDSRMILALQKFLQPVVDAPTSLQRIYESGRFAQQGLEERTKGIDPEWVTESNSQRPQSQRLAGDADTGKGIDSSSKLRSVMSSQYETWIQQTSTAPGATGTEVAEPLAATQLVSTASAKLSYLIDQIVKYQDSEQMIVFYEHENVAYYLAGVLEIVSFSPRFPSPLTSSLTPAQQLQIQHLIYAKSLTVKRRAQYVATFNSNPKFR